MNIMFLIFSFNVGGIERLLIDLCNSMVVKRHHVSLCVINNDYTPSLLNELSPEISVFFLNRESSTNNHFLKKNNFHKYMIMLSKLVKENHIQIIHCQGINCVLFASIAKILNPQTIILNTVHDSGNYPSYSTLKIILQNIFCSMTVAISNSVQQEILSRHVNPSKVTIIYNAIDTHKFQYIPKSLVSLKNKKSINIGNVARFFPQKKGQDILVKAVELLLPNYPNLHCYFAGEILPDQKNEYSKLTEYISDKELENHFSFLGNVNDIPGFLSNLDIFVLPSNYEGFGISLIEAMATGLPCIASRLEGPEEIISDSNLGILFAPGDVGELSKAIDKIIQNRSLYNPQEISKNINTRFNIQTAAQKHLELYKKLLTK